jgi:hypothetical protein
MFCAISSHFFPHRGPVPSGLPCHRKHGCGSCGWSSRAWAPNPSPSLSPRKTLGVGCWPEYPAATCSAVESMRFVGRTVRPKAMGQQAPPGSGAEVKLEMPATVALFAIRSGSHPSGLARRASAGSCCESSYHPSGLSACLPWIRTFGRSCAVRKRKMTHCVW